MPASPPVMPRPVPPSRPEAAADGSAAWRPLSRGWRWGIALYALAVAFGIALALLMTGGPGSGRIAVLVGLLQEPYLQLSNAYRGEDDTEPDVEYVIFESEDGGAQGLRAYLQGRQDIRFQSKGTLPGVSVVRIQRDTLRASLDDLHRQPFVTMVLKAGVGMICH